MVLRGRVVLPSGTRAPRVEVLERAGRGRPYRVVGTVRAGADGRFVPTVRAPGGGARAAAYLLRSRVRISRRSPRTAVSYGGTGVLGLG